MQQGAHRFSGPVDAADLRARAARTLHPAPPYLDPEGGPVPPSDFDLSPDLQMDLAPAALRAAAVLVPIVARPELTLLLTQRTDHLPAHAGQISFPGGKIEPTDPSPVACALREAQEEIGLASELVEPLGFLDSYRTGTGFSITPVVALVDPSFTLVLDPNEVVDAFEVPLAFLVDPANLQIHDRVFAGKARRFYAIPFEQRFIWGATAGMLRNLCQRLFSA